MKLTYVDKNGNQQLIEGFDCMSDDDEWITITVKGNKKVIHKSDMLERTYTIC